MSGRPPAAPAVATGRALQALRVPAAPYRVRGMAELLLHHAETSPHKLAFNFIDYAGEAPVDRGLSCAQLLVRARQIAALLQTRCQPGDRAMLLYPAGLDYLCAFFGCMHAGVVAVPAYPPHNPRLASRLAAVAADCRASVALTTSAALAGLGPPGQLAPPLAQLHWLATDVDLSGWEHVAAGPALSPQGLAFLQYTSGSTGTPKGVMVTHGNLLDNLRLIALHMQFDLEDRHLSWLPPYHDMGLIGATLGSFAAGVRLDFMAPMAFLRKPERWLREISKRRSTLSGAPNFAFELCMAKVAEQAIGTLDLSSWDVAYCGAEPVRASTLRRFAERFAPAGFDPASFYPCYGMAETTLFVTGVGRKQGHAAVHIDHGAYSQQRKAVVSADAQRTQPLVGCGTVADGHRLAIVDPQTLVPCGEGQVAEILVGGPSVAAGYWERPAESAASFELEVPGVEGRFLRTGDLGFLLDGVLHVSGRLKDTIIIRGANLYAHDIEASVDRCHEAIRQGCGIAFSIEAGGAEQLVFVQEVGKSDLERADQVVSSIRKSIFEDHDVQPYAIVLIESGKIPKTTSGKLARRPCKEQFLEQTLPVLMSWTNPLFQAAAFAAAPVRVPVDCGA